MDTKARIGQRIKAIRKYKIGSQARLAELTGRSLETISSIERGKSLPNIETLERLAKALDVPMREFFDVPEGRRSKKQDALLAEIDALLMDKSEQQLKTVLDVIKALEAKG